jgi:hypothetical protein
VKGKGNNKKNSSQNSLSKRTSITEMSINRNVGKQICFCKYENVLDMMHGYGNI